MRSINIALHLALICSHLVAPLPPDSLPFIPTLDQVSSPYSQNDTFPQSEDESGSFELLKRQYCPLNSYSCATIAAVNVCCGTDYICSLDSANSPACCSVGSVCTGIVNAPNNSPGSPAISTNLATIATSGFVVVTSANVITPTTTAAAIGAAATISYVPNTYFQFPYIGSSFSNGAACTAAYAGCSTNFVQCTSRLVGGNTYGVTIQAPGGGITLAPAAVTTLPAASAAAVCTTLSNLACPGSPANCGMYVAAASGGAVAWGAEAGKGAYIASGFWCIAMVGWLMS